MRVRVIYSVVKSIVRKNKKGFNNYLKNKKKYYAVAKPNKIIWLNPADIQYYIKIKDPKKLKKCLGTIKSGPWDLNVKSFDNYSKHISLYQHFIDGIPWNHTDKFRNDYLKRINAGKKVRGFSTMQELTEFYKAIDHLYNDIANEGFFVPGRFYSPRNFCIYIGRNGELLLGSDGNHRLSIAKILKLKKIPAKVQARHEKWQQKRDLLFSSVKSGKQIEGSILPLINHVDMQDIMIMNTVKQLSDNIVQTDM